MRFLVWLKSIDWRHRRLQAENERLVAENAQLQAQLDEVAASRIELQADNHRLKADIREVWQRLDTALTAEREAYQMQLNISYQQKYGFAPYPGVAHLPESMVRNPEADLVMESPFVNARTLVARQTEQERRAIYDSLRADEVAQ